VLVTNFPSPFARLNGLSVAVHGRCFFHSVHSVTRGADVWASGFLLIPRRLRLGSLWGGALPSAPSFIPSKSRFGLAGWLLA
jgi:hypothetical protein